MIEKSNAPQCEAAVAEAALGCCCSKCPKRPFCLKPDEARALIREAVRETFLMLGVKVDDPIEVQKDFQYLRDWRTTTDSIKSKGLLTLVGILVSGLVAAVWLGIKAFLGK